MAMWADVQLGPWAARRRRRALVVWDNCGPHSVPACSVVLAEHDIRAEALPPKMTSVLQVMDRVVNGSLKAAIRRARVDALFDYFQLWKLKRLQALAKPEAERVMPAYSQPKSALGGGLLALTAACRGTFTRPGEPAARLCEGGPAASGALRAVHGGTSAAPSRWCCHRQTRPPTTHSCSAMQSRSSRWRRGRRRGRASRTRPT